MKTKKNLSLFLSVFAMFAMIVFCSSVGFAQEPYLSRYTFIDNQIIKSKDKGRICIKLDPKTQCGKPVKCGTNDYIEGIPVKALFNVNYIEVPGSSCNSFTADIPGNTRYYCSGGYCYPY
jgi:hypothetical protein